MAEDKTKQIPFRMTASEHTGLKILAAKQGKSIQQLLIDALDKAFPEWRDEGKK